MRRLVPRPTRRRVLALIASGGILGATRLSAEPTPTIKVWKDPNCGCCSGWVEHLRRNGFPVEVFETADVQAIKAQRGVPAALASCHTAEIGRYTIEGHVPAAAMRRLLLERPEALGLAVPGMPVGSPGMEGGKPEIYQVVLFGKGSAVVYGRFLGDRPA
jgi:hypothetical protein